MPAVAAKRVAGFLVLGIGLLVVFPAHAFRCGSFLVQEGDTKHAVISKCGAPDFRDQHAGVYLEGIGPVGVTETWYYNPGPARLIRILTFHRGRLRSIKTGGRGFNEDIPGDRCQPYALDIGMSKYELLSRCGKPAARDRWFEHSGSRFHPRHRLHGAVLVEEWTYTFGSNRFRRHIRIRQGRVVGIERGGKGE